MLSLNKFINNIEITISMNKRGRHAHHYLQYSLFIFMMVLIVFFVRSPTLTGMAVYEE